MLIFVSGKLTPVQTFYAPIETNYKYIDATFAIDKLTTLVGKICIQPINY